MLKFKYLVAFLGVVGMLALTIFAYQQGNLFVSTAGGVLLGFLLSRLETLVRRKTGRSFL